MYGLGSDPVGSAYAAGSSILSSTLVWSQCDYRVVLTAIRYPSARRYFRKPSPIPHVAHKPTCRCRPSADLQQTVGVSGAQSSMAATP